MLEEENLLTDCGVLVFSRLLVWVVWVVRPYRTNWIVFQHAQRTVGTWADQRLVVAGHGHGDEAHGNGAGLDCEESFVSSLL